MGCTRCVIKKSCVELEVWLFSDLFEQHSRLTRVSEDLMSRKTESRANQMAQRVWQILCKEWWMWPFPSILTTLISHLIRIISSHTYNMEGSYLSYLGACKIRSLPDACGASYGRCNFFFARTGDRWYLSFANVLSILDHLCSPQRAS